MQASSAERPWEDLALLIAAGDRRGLEHLLDELGPAESARALSRLRPEEHRRLIELLGPQEAADLIEEVPTAQAADLIEELSPPQAAAVLDAMPSDQQVDLLAELSRRDAQAILDQMPPEHAADLRARMSYDPDTAGGMMVTEYLAYPADFRVRQVVADLQANRHRYANYDVQYVYVIDPAGRLVGVLRMRDLVFTPQHSLLSEVMIADPLHVRADQGLEELNAFFSQHRLFGVPVVDQAGRLIGVVSRSGVQAAISNRLNRQFLGISGIIGGEEFRSMPLMVRSGRRLVWLVINIALNVVAASVIALHQDTLRAAIALAVFLPIISDMSSCSGSQAMAVSLRELAVGLIRPNEHFRVLLKESLLGIINGIVLGLILAALAFLWKGNVYLGLIVGAALAINILVSVLVGGTLPLVLKRFGLDPALVTSPILTTITDTCGFLLALQFASLALPYLPNG